MRFKGTFFFWNAIKRIPWQFFVPILGWLSDPRLSELQLRDQKVTLNHLVQYFFFFNIQSDPFSLYEIM